MGTIETLSAAIETPVLGSRIAFVCHRKQSTRAKCQRVNSGSSSRAHITREAPSAAEGASTLERFAQAALPRTAHVHHAHIRAAGDHNSLHSAHSPLRASTLNVRQCQETALLKKHIVLRHCRRGATTQCCRALDQRDAMALTFDTGAV